MYELPSIIPDVDDLLALEPEELGVKLIPLLQRRFERNANEMVILSNLQQEPFGRPHEGGRPRYPDHARDKFVLAMAEAWSWLQAQGLLVPAEGMNGSNGYRVLSRRARRFADEAEVSRFFTARLLSRDALHPKIAPKVWSAFIRGEYDVAVLQAMKGVEVAVREAAGLGNDAIGVSLMSAAFREGGPLADATSEKGEQVARMNLFAGSIGSYKNSHSHREVRLEDPMEAVELVLLANHLLRIVDARAAAKKAHTP